MKKKFKEMKQIQGISKWVELELREVKTWLVEAKCPYCHRNENIEHCSTCNKILINSCLFIDIATHSYYQQFQMELFVGGNVDY